MGAVAVSLFWLGLVTVYALRIYGGFPSRISLLPYQGGLLYRRGLPVREVGPGRHRVFVGIEKILFLDKRPIQISMENRIVTLSDGATAIYGFIASAQVNDIRKGLYSSAAYTQFPAFVTLCTSRTVLNACESDQLKLGLAAISQDITNRCRTRLAAGGFELLTFRLTQLNIAQPAPTKS
jgi:hypothetical protein